jgi:hypothetical protein
MRESGVGHGLDVLEPFASASLGLECASMLDRQRRPVGGQLQQLSIIGRESAVLQRAHVDHTDDPGTDLQRNAEQRFDPLLAQDRIEDVCVIDVVENHGATLCRYPACESAPERDAHATLDLLLEADCRSRHEFTGFLIEQQHSTGIGIEHLARAQQERGKQLLEIQRRQRRVGERLQALQARVS